MNLYIVLLILWCILDVLRTTPVSGRSPIIRCGSDVRVPNNACRVGGSLTLTTVPSNLAVDQNNCDIVYPFINFLTRPNIIYHDAKENDLYSCVYLDKDSPLKFPDQENIFVLHFLAVNIRGGDFKKGDLSKGNIISGFIPNIPLFNRIYHRYLVFVFIQKDQVRVPFSEENPLYFNLTEYVTKNAANGVLLCGPVTSVQYRLSFFYPL